MQDKFNALITRVGEYASQEEEGGMWTDIHADLIRGDGRIAVGLFDTMHRRNQAKADLGGNDRETYQGYADFHLEAAQTVRVRFNIPSGESKIWLPVIRKEKG